MNHAQSSWLRDALSEIDSSCEKITLISSPPEQAEAARRPGTTAAAPVFRIHAEGAFGTTEVRVSCSSHIYERIIVCAVDGLSE
jgi:hypothetical protein